MIRIDPALHRKAAQRAEAEGLNAWIARQIDAAWPRPTAQLRSTIRANARAAPAPWRAGSA
jgi:hypothetical protein